MARRPSLDLRHLREREKEELGELNIRLEAYVKYVEEVETENEELRARLASLEGSMDIAESTDLLLCKDEIKTLRDALDRQAKQSAEAQLETQRFAASLRDANEKHDAERRELEAEIDDLKAQLDDDDKLKARLRRAETDLRAAQKQLGVVTDERDALAAKNNELQAENERLSMEVLDLTNNLQTAREDHEFKAKMWEQERIKLERALSTARAAVRSQPIEKASYNDDLAEALAEARKRYEAEGMAFYDALRELYESRGVRVNLKKSGNNVSAAVQGEMQELRSNLERTSSKLASYQSQVSNMRDQIASLNSTIDEMRAAHEQEVDQLEQSLKDAQDELDNKTAAYRDLLDVKIALDAEIAHYRRLLNGLEGRLTPRRSEGRDGASERKKRKRDSVATPKAQAAADADASASPEEAYSRVAERVKRRRFRYSDNFGAASAAAAAAAAGADGVNLAAETETPGAVHIDEVNVDGLYVKLTNRTDEDIQLKKWHLVNKDAEGQENAFTFKKVTLPACGSITVWSESAGTAPSDSDIVWKGLELFAAQAGCTVTLFDSMDGVSCKTSLIAQEQEVYQSSCSLM